MLQKVLKCSFQEKLIQTDNNLILENSLEKFLEVFIDTLVIFASCKKKYSRGNNMPFMNKSLLSANIKKTKNKKENS